MEVVLNEIIFLICHGGKVKCALWKSVLKWVWWTLFSLFVLLLVGIAVAVNFIFTPEKLTPLVDENGE